VREPLVGRDGESEKDVEKKAMTKEELKIYNS
jgi:hypothetical protein